MSPSALQAGIPCSQWLDTVSFQELATLLEENSYFGPPIPEEKMSAFGGLGFRD